MIGAKTLEINATDIALRGMSTSPFVADGAFAPNIGLLDSQFNPQAQPGVIYGVAAEVNGDGSAVLTDEIIASCPDHQAVGTDARLVVTKESTGSWKYYRYSGTALGTLLEADTTNTDYDHGSTDMVVYKGRTYITTKGTMIELSGSDTWNKSYFALTSSFYHPMVVFEDNLYIGNGNALLRQTSAGGTPAIILTLPTGDIITALGIDRGTGELLVTTITGASNVSNTLTNISKLNWYDGFSNKVDKSVQIDDQVFSMYSVGNTTYMGYGQSIGYLNGSSISFLRRLRNVALDDTELPYKHKFAHIGSTLFVADGHIVLAFGEIIPGRKVWWQIFEAASNTQIDAIMPVGSNKLGISYATTKFSTIDITDTSTISTLRLVTNKLNFERPIILRNVYFEYVTAIATGSANRTLELYDVSTGYDTAVILNKEGESNLANTSGSTIYEIYPVIGFNDATRGFQLHYLQTTTNWGLRRILINYDFYE